jgi:hypothetical protein
VSSGGKTVIQRRLVFVIALFVFGCASGGGDSAAPASGPSALGSGAKIGQIQVIVDEQLSADVRAVITQYQAAERLEAEVGLALAQRGGMDDDGELQMRITIDRFRLRSNQASIWLGSMAGADSIGVAVSIRRGDEAVKTFTTNTSSIQGGLAMPGRTVRLTRLISELARRVADGA